ncbi:hypothetical protein KXD40_001543 [Peronospora effusa]|uniref:Uncharacterized protein n=1 Tax=Peronospora effusa TaxID=542832 RepID=A0A3M6V9D8_9STRA|nr:hypothetical protein DD238_007555 [Peronospora effusa]RQM12215.1 hypothetical protein DD237_007826 [Peronospora effusa]UIZ26592.1 hypothetical protein KXD40_001543 [Peronospora effusa]CAI5711519.1 unnamed protein product [Peronospora effusa]
MTSNSNTSSSTRRIVRRPLRFASPAKEQQYRTEIDHVQQYICAQLGGLDETSIQLLGVHDSRSRSYYEEIQEFLERKHQLEQQQQRTEKQYPERVLIQDLDEYLNELDPSLFVESMPIIPKRLAVAELPAHSSYIRRKQEEAIVSRLWTKYQTAETERYTMASISLGSPMKRQRVV